MSGDTPSCLLPYHFFTFSSFDMAQVSSPPGNVVIAWSNIYLNAVRLTVGGAPGPLARIGGLMHLAMFEAANLLTKPTPLYNSSIPGVKPPVGTFDTAAVAHNAARYVLKALFPEYIKADLTAQASMKAQGFANDSTNQCQVLPQAETLLSDKALDEAFPPAPSTGDPVVDANSDSLGSTIAQAVLTAQPVGNGLDPTVTPPLDPAQAGEWRETGSGPALTPQWGKVPLALLSTSTRDYLPTIIAEQTYQALLTSDEYGRQVKDVQAKGAVNSTTRTDEETETAFFWANDGDKTYKPPGQLFSITQIVAKQEGIINGQVAGNGLLETARLFAMVGTAMLNASIVAWQAKYFGPDEAAPIRLWRPETAIKEAATDGNPETMPEAGWQPLSVKRDGTHFSPNFPAYVSGHSTFGAAHAAAMRDFFGTDTIAFTVTTDDPSAIGVTRSFTCFTDAAKQNGRSRVLLGVHYQFDADGGYEIGTKVGEETAQWFGKLLTGGKA